MTRRMREEAKNIVEKLGYIFIDEYIGENRKRRVSIQDSKGYKYNVVLSNLIRNKNPDFVGTYNPYSLENISLWLKLNNKSFGLEYESSYR